MGRDADSGQSRFYGFVEMKTSDEARLAARSLNATRLDGRLLSVNRAARS
jgi:RNA recognition motif-containing protein